MAEQMPQGDPAPQGSAEWEGEQSFDTTGDSNPSDTQHSDQQAQEPEYSVDSALRASGDSPSNDGAADDVGEYDPESVTIAAEPPQDPAEHESPKPEPQPAPKKRKTAGGFLVGDSDSEDDETPVPNGLLAEPIAQTQALAQEPAAVTSNAPQPPQMISHPGMAAYGLAPGASASVAEPNPPQMTDTTALLEARIKDDPRGALDSWLALIAEHQRTQWLDEARSVYNRFLEVFPQSADIWVKYAEMELGLGDFQAAEGIFTRSLQSVPNVQLWTVYLDYIRRRNDLSDTSGQARLTVTRSYEFVLDNVGMDKDSGRIWQDYIQFIRSGPGTIGGSGWQDQQKMDQLRKAYQRAVCVPISNVNQLWKEYDQFEMGLNKMTGRKFLAERSPSYMTAKSANTALDNIIRELQRTNLPRLPPAPGFQGDEEFTKQVQIWKRWIEWEKSDPLDLQGDDPNLLQQRILYCYKQALMALRFWPEMWVDAAEWCFENNITKDGKEAGSQFLADGIEANPESVLLALKQADRIESTYPVENSEDSRIAFAGAVRAPYNNILDTLYTLLKNLKEKEKLEITKLEESLAAADSAEADQGDEYDEDGAGSDKGAKENAKQEKIKLIKQGFSVQADLLSKTLTHVWIALARAMRRIHGKGDTKGPIVGLRQVFYEARQRGRLGSEIYVAVAKMELKCYNDKSGGKILERGAKLFPEDPYFMIEYIKYLISQNDKTNSRVAFETCVNRLASKPETVNKAKPLIAYVHKHESMYGDLSRVAELEKRMAELYPEDPKLARFSARYSSEKFDPVHALIIVSPAAQLKPKLPLGFEPPSINDPNPMRIPIPIPLPGTQLPAQQQASPRPQFIQAAPASTNSPKRPFPSDDFDDAANPPRKMLRGDQREFVREQSPLKGAAGRRLDQQRRLQGQGPSSSSAYSSAGGAPAPISTSLTFLLGQIPSAAAYAHSPRFNPAKLVGLVQQTDVPDLISWENSRKGRPLAQPQHARQVSGDYGRNSPGLGGGARPLSPYSGDRGRVAPSSATYRQSSLRPESRDTYEPPPAAGYAAPYAQPPPAAAGYDGGGPPAGWQPPPGAVYGGAPPPQVGGYTVPQYQQQAPPQPGQPPYGGYRY
ncbi:uncharacterized protein E0L32_002746 [Thyridium curvatum]|uniref:mRNA 3'-end-processing protein RNA14 n=1 Tax=Thyridium curvatum TaxID=1093900 RepID=A0A507BE58_9PEZI|nr:uncharacterized protein E0L32_002746 [Thyridium curvatum]TPX18237.1 hypothetical protein E0L32_002746 [Thyridium curvatum]